MAKLLAWRGVADGAEAAAFLAPASDQLHDPAGLQGMDEAVARLQTALDHGERDVPDSRAGTSDHDRFNRTVRHSAVGTNSHLDRSVRLLGSPAFEANQLGEPVSRDRFGTDLRLYCWTRTTCRSDGSLNRSPRPAALCRSRPLYPIPHFRHAACP